MLLNKASITILLSCALTSASILGHAQDNKKSRIRPVIPYNHSTLAAPPGMVYIRGGSTKIKYNQSSTDTNSYRKVALSAFFMDKTEVTNQQYRKFVNWVIDSIAITKYLKDDKYYIEDVKDKNATASTAAVPPTPPAPPAPLDSAQLAAGATPPPAIPPTVTDSSRMAAAKTDTVRRRIDWSKVNHEKLFDTKNAEVRSKLQPMLDENGNIKKEMYVFDFTYLKTNGSANPKEKKNKYVTEPINIYPNEKVWQDDLSNSQTDLYVENYFKAPPFDDYPVVGVTWMQARAYCAWRSLVAEKYYNMPDYMKYYHLIYTLPSEAQWVYAAQGYYDMIRNTSDTLAKPEALKLPSDSTVTPHDSAYVAMVAKHAAEDSAYNAIVDERKAAAEGNMYIGDYLNFRKRKNAVYTIEGREVIDSTPIHKDRDGMLANFKQDEGEYNDDGGSLTLPVMAYAPNEFGLYNMEGNVSEWMMDAYSPSAFYFVSDLNPVLLYDADSTDSDAMRRKVVRGGSFMSNAKSLGPYYRDLELQNLSHCYLGFRCVIQAPEIMYKNVSTRNRSPKGKKTEGKLSNLRLPEIH